MLYNKMEQSVVQQFMRYDAAKASRPSQSGSDDHQASTSRPFTQSTASIRRLQRHEIAFAVCGLVMTLPCIAGWSSVGTW